MVERVGDEAVGDVFSASEVLSGFERGLDKSGIVSIGLNVGTDGGLPLCLRDAADGEGLGLLLGDTNRRGAVLGMLNFRIDGSSSGSSGTTSTLRTLVGLDGKLDIRMTLDRLWPFRLDPFLLGLNPLGRSCIASRGDHWKGFRSLVSPEDGPVCSDLGGVCAFPEILRSGDI